VFSIVRACGDLELAGFYFSAFFSRTFERMENPAITCPREKPGTVAARGKE
jgi:hypothetical protein